MLCLSVANLYMTNIDLQQILLSITILPLNETSISPFEWRRGDRELHVLSFLFNEVLKLLAVFRTAPIFL